MFLDLDKKPQSSIAAIENTNTSISYGELCSFNKEFFGYINRRALIFIISENCIGSLAGYVASLSGKIVPLILSVNTDAQMLDNLINIYLPEYLWVPFRLVEKFRYTVVFEKLGYCLLKTGYAPSTLNNDLSMLLPTSGSTGSSKLVRHSYLNIEANARNVAALFELSSEERAIAVLPMYYTMGLSVVTSHLFAGSTVLLINGTLTDSSFWTFIKEHKATSFTGIPYSFEVLHRLRFFRMDLPHLRILTQGGGKLRETLFKEFAEFAVNTDRKFIATYGQTEGTARMAYLKADMAVTKTGSIGKAIPNGQLSIIDEEGREITEPEGVGEMVYSGPNVTLGYALNGADLAKGDENKGVLKTGDIARRDKDGYYYIVGRLSRFLKLYSTRIGLDETEMMIRSFFNVDCTCGGNDEKMIIKITDAGKKDAIHDYVVEKTGLFHTAIDVVVIDEIPRNEVGKSIY